jgi:hypothetical protein
MDRRLTEYEYKDAWMPECDRIGGMQITEVRVTGKGPETILVGRIVDQASLSGILNTLYELHLPVLSVECVDTDS